MRRRLRYLLAAVLGVVFAFASPAQSQPQSAAASTPAPGDDNETRRARALFDAYWEETARLHPEWATERGDHRFGDRLTDASVEGLAAEDAFWRSLQQRARAIDRSRLAPTDQVSVELLLQLTDDEVGFQSFDGYRTMTVSAAPFAFQSQFVGLLRDSPVATAPQVEQMLARMAVWPRRVEQEIARLRRGSALGWVPPRTSLQQVLKQLDAQLARAPERSPYYEPFERLGSDIAPAEQAMLKRRALQAVEAQLLPALRRLRDFVAGEYLAAAPHDGALSRYPGGDKVYEALVRSHTTTALTPQQIHRLGLEKLAAVRAEMDAVIRATGFAGDFAAFVSDLQSNPKYFAASGDALLAAYRDIAKRIDPELPRLFAVLPRAPYGVRAQPEFPGPDAAESYDSPALDGSRPGWFNANIAGYKTRPIWGLETLVAHEAVPGHHLQWARAAELEGLPAFRRDTFFTAYNEGWALYAETLGSELGLYRDPRSRFGHLQMQAFRAARLVVDTGLHAFGWSRQRAIDFMVERTGVEAGKVESEVDRYIAWPGQALAYMIGQTKIIELRERARSALKARFDVRRFHNVVLDSGQVPLDVLERLVDAWIAAEQAAAPR